jgi:PAS domain S-box-containing protein
MMLVCGGHNLRQDAIHGVLSRFRVGERIPNNEFLQQSSQTQTSYSQELGIGESPIAVFPYRSNDWKLEHPSPRDIEERLAVATIAADIGIWDIDLRSGSLQGCHRCKKIFGASFAPERWRESVFELIHREDRERVRSSMEAALNPQGTGVFDTEYRIHRRDGETRWVATNGKVFFEDVDGKPTAIRFLGTLLDRTEQKLAHEALAESEKLAVTGRLAASIAHEIKNSLESVSNLLYLLRDETSVQKRNEFVTLAEAELKQLNDIASNTLHFYRAPAGGNTVDVGDLIRSVLLLFGGRISALQVRVQTELPIGTGVDAPPGELRQVLVNLVVNALDAMTKGGRLVIRARELTGKTGEKCVRLTVADTGLGMSAEVRSRVFEAFYTTKKTKGTGIGLWLSQEIIKKCGSKIHVKSIQGRGTVFSLYLPGLSQPNYGKTIYDKRALDANGYAHHRSHDASTPQASG